MSQEELLKAQIRMSAMQAAVAWYCCNRDADHPVGVPIEQLPDQLLEVMGTLMQLRDLFVKTALDAANPDPLSPPS